MIAAIKSNRRLETQLADWGLCVRYAEIDRHVRHIWAGVALDWPTGRQDCLADLPSRCSRKEVIRARYDCSLDGGNDGKSQTQEVQRRHDAEATSRLRYVN